MKKQFLILMAVLIAFTAFSADPVKVQPINMSATAKAQYKSALDILTTASATTTYVKIADLQDPTNMIDSISSIARFSDKTDNYTFQFSGAFGSSTNDLGKTFTMTASSDKTFTIPLNATDPFPIGSIINVINIGTGDCSIAITATGTLLSESSWVKIGGRYTGVTLLKTATNTWVILGRLKA